MVRGTRAGLVSARRRGLLQRDSADGARHQRHLSRPSRAMVTGHQPRGLLGDPPNNLLSFLRFGDDGSILACVFNFSGSEHTRYRLGLPHAGTWREVPNTDADIYNGTGIGNYGAVEATDEPWHGRPASAVMVLPPLAALWFEPALPPHTAQ